MCFRCAPRWVQELMYGRTRRPFNSPILRTYPATTAPPGRHDFRSSLQLVVESDSLYCAEASVMSLAACLRTEGLCLPLVQDLFHCLIVRGLPSEGILSSRNMRFRASSDCGLQLGFRLLALLGADRYPDIMDIYSTFFVVGRRRDCLNERSVRGTQVFFV